MCPPVNRAREETYPGEHAGSPLQILLQPHQTQNNGRGQSPAPTGPAVPGSRPMGSFALALYSGHFHALPPVPLPGYRGKAALPRQGGLYHSCTPRGKAAGQPSRSRGKESAERWAFCTCQVKVDTKKRISTGSPVQSCIELGFYSLKQLLGAGC